MSTVLGSFDPSSVYPQGAQLSPRLRDPSFVLLSVCLRAGVQCSPRLIDLFFAYVVRYYQMSQRANLVCLVVHVGRSCASNSGHLLKRVMFVCVIEMDWWDNFAP